jgi:hypothetical protein
MEVDKAESGLISFLKTPGPGLERGEREEAIVILKKYVEKKAEFNLSKLKESIRKIFKKNPFNIKTISNILHLADKITNSNSAEEIAEYGKQFQEIIDKSSFGKGERQEPKDFLIRLAEWQIYKIQHNKSESIKEKSEFPESETLKEKPQEPDLVGEKNMEPTVINKSPLKTSKNLSSIILKSIFLLLLAFFILFYVLYIFTKKQKNKLIYFYHDNPKAFIINLYENLKEVLRILGIDYKEHMLPLFFAELVEKKYSMEGGLLLKFTSKFEEAKYSQHILKSDDANFASDNYNNFLKVALCNYNRFQLILIHLSALFNLRPIFISE